MMTRRSVLASLGALLALPTVVRAQTTAGMRRIVWFGLGPLDARSPYLDALRGELRELGWSEGRNLTISRYSSTRAPDDFEVLAREIVAAKPDVVVTQEFTVSSMHRIQAAVLVVFGFSGDPVDGKLVQSYAHPGTNYTGMSYLASELVGKRIEFLKEALPHIRRLAILASRSIPASTASGRHQRRRHRSWALPSATFRFARSSRSTRLSPRCGRSAVMRSLCFRTTSCSSIESGSPVWHWMRGCRRYPDGRPSRKAACS